ncbi:MAG TPA: lysophospholipid acyltransferase family protein [Tepidisphaeraceae bacterium]|nr:lysophospholipid acyltransferase family protein [Tepidisphaeraceae bacterium]
MERSLLWKSLQVVGRVLTSLLFELKVYGIENVPQTGGALLVANHQSYLDPVLVAVRLRRPVSFLAKSELFENPFLRWLITSLHAFPVRQGRGDHGAVRETIRRLDEGHILNMYPEGTRTSDGEIGRLEKGIALILRKTTVPVIPVAIEGSFQAWPNRQKLFRPGRIHVIYGKPLHFNEMRSDEIMAALDSALRKLFEQLREMRSFDLCISK